MRPLACVLLFLALWFRLAAGVPVTVTPVTGAHGMVVAGHPQAAEAGLAILQAGGNAVDAAVATSLAVGVAEPYGSGLGGKLMLLFFEAKSGRVYAVDAMDAAGAVDIGAYARRPADERGYGYGEVCVPGLGAGLWAAHQRWGSRPWAEVLQPAIALARTGFRVLAKTREQFEAKEQTLRRGDAEIARLYLPSGRLPEAGSLLRNEDLARTLEAMARHGRDGFYRGPVAAALVTAAKRGGGWLTAADLADYEARITEPLTMQFRDFTLYAGPPPTSGATLFLPMLKVLENDSLRARPPLRTAANLDRLGRVFREVLPAIERTVGDQPESVFLVEKLLAPDAIAAVRERALGAAATARKVVGWSPTGETWPFHESEHAATTHFVVADRQGNIVCATQSQSLHFGAGVVPPGTGVVMNNSMSNFTTDDPLSLNYVAPGKRSRSTIGPTIILRGGRPVLAIGLPGSSRIPTALAQVLWDYLAWGRPLAEAIGDTRIHFQGRQKAGELPVVESEGSLPLDVANGLRRLGWKVELREPAGTGVHFGGINAIEFNRDGTPTGFADPRRSNVAVGY